MVECLPSMGEALGSMLSTTKINLHIDLMCFIDYVAVAQLLIQWLVMPKQNTKIISHTSFHSVAEELRFPTLPFRGLRNFFHKPLGEKNIPGCR